LPDAPIEDPSLNLTLGLVRQGWSEPPIQERIGDRHIGLTEYPVPGPAGQEFTSVAVFTATDAKVPAPAIYNIHGGAMIVGDRFASVESLFELIERYKLAVVSVEYRLAPEYPDPVPVEDCYAGLVWIVSHSADLGIDGRRLVIAGASAGGGLAAGVALMARDRQGPRLSGQLLMSPMLDDRATSLSNRQYADVDIAHVCRLGWDALLGPGHAQREVSPYAAPGRAEDLSGLPPAFIDVGSAEALRDEGVAYAAGMWASGGQAELHVWAGGFHGFQFEEAPISVAARGAWESWLTRTIGL
jgi:acetyl esterase/lipase